MSSAELSRAPHPAETPAYSHTVEDRPAPTDAAMPPEAEPGREYGKRILAALRYNPGVVLSALVLALFFLIAVAPWLFTSYDPLLANPRQALQPPSPEHIFGTDNIGRDLFARVAYGSGASLRAAGFAVVLAFVLGSALGTLAGTGPRWIDNALSCVFESLLAIPHMLLILTLLAVLGSGVDVIALGIGLAGSVSFGRLMRAESLRIRSMSFVEAAVASGVKPTWVVIRHIVPNAMRPLVALAALDFGMAMLTIGAMSYLGFGQTPPTPEWGRMIAEGQAFLRTAPWLSVLPGLMFVIVVVAVSRVSRAIGGRNG